MDAQGRVNFSYPFEVPIQVSKIAKLAENRHWHIAILAEKNNDFASSSFYVHQEFGVTWYGEIALDSPGAFVWPLQPSGGEDPLNPMNNVLVGTDFEGSTNQTSLMVRYISNGNYQQTIQASGMTWESNIGNPLNNGLPYKANLVTSTPQNPQEMAIKFSYSGVSQFNPSLPYLTDQFEVLMEKNSFTSSPEEGDLYDYNLFVSLADVFQNGTYRGVVNIGIRDPFYVILNLNTENYYAGTTFGQLSQSFGFSGVQQAADQAVIDATSGQTIQLKREITANLFIPVGAISILADYSADRGSFILDFDKHRLNGNITIQGFGTNPSQVYLSGLGIINGTLTIDGRELSVTSDAEVMGNTFIHDTSLSSYRISERHHSPIIVGDSNQGRTRIISTNNAIDAVVHIETIERVYFEGGFERVVFDNNTTDFDFDVHARFDNATVAEIEVLQNAEIYIADGSSITSGFITPSNRTARIYLESGATIAGTLDSDGENGSNRLYSTFTGSGIYDLTEFHGNVVNMRTQTSYTSLQTAYTAALTNDVLRIREMVLDEAVYFNFETDITLEGIQRDYNAFERYESFEAGSFRNRGESVLVNLLDITRSGTTINGVKFDLAVGKQLTTSADDSTFEYLWVTKSHAQSGIEAAVLITNVSGLLVDESAFVRIASTVQDENRHGILMSGILNNIHVQNSNFELIAGKNIGVTGASFENVQFNNNTHERSMDGDTNNDAMIHIVNREFKDALIENITMIDPFIRGIVVQTNEISSIVQNITINNVDVIGDNANQLYSNIVFDNTADNATFQNIEINNSQFDGIISNSQSHILFQTAGNSVLFDDITIHANILSDDSSSTNNFIELASKDINNDLVTWSDITISSNNIQHRMNNGIL